MAQRIYLHRRRTHTYRDGWAHLDKHSPLGVAKILAPRAVVVGNGYDECLRLRFKAVLGSGIDLKRGAVALDEYFRAAFTSSCHHEHDCCGCRFAYVDVQHRRGRDFSVTLQVMRNY